MPRRARRGEKCRTPRVAWQRAARRDVHAVVPSTRRSPPRPDDATSRGHLVARDLAIRDMGWVRCRSHATEARRGKDELARRDLAVTSRAAHGGGCRPRKTGWGPTRFDVGPTPVSFSRGRVRHSVRRMLATDDEPEMLLAAVESHRVERTVSFEKGDKFREAICAFANDLPGTGAPGYLFIGATDDGKWSGKPVTDQLLLALTGIRSEGDILPPPRMSRDACSRAARWRSSRCSPRRCRPFATRGAYGFGTCQRV